MKKTYLLLFLFFFFLLLSSALELSAQDSLESNIIPDFEAVTLNGDSVYSSDYAGKVTLINLWGIWCPPCVEELPHLQKVYKHYRDNTNVRVVAIHCTIGRSRKEVKKWVEEQELALPIIYDDDTSIMDAFGLGGIPDNIFIDTQGRIVKTIDDRPHETFEERAIAIIEDMLQKNGSN